MNPAREADSNQRDRPAHGDASEQEVSPFHDEVHDGVWVRRAV